MKPEEIVDDRFRMPDAMWERIEVLLPKRRRRKVGGRPPLPWRLVIDGIFYVLRTGCHGACEDRDPHMGMDEAGFWVKHGTTPEFDPRNVAIMLHGAGGGGLVVWLGTDGRYLFRSPLEVAA